MKKLLFSQNIDEFSRKSTGAREQAEPADHGYSIPNEASCSAEFSDGCILKE